MAVLVDEPLDDRSDPVGLFAGSGTAQDDWKQRCLLVGVMLHHGLVEQLKRELGNGTRSLRLL